MIQFVTHQWRDLLWAAGFLAAAIVAAFAARIAVFWLLRRVTGRRGAVIGHSLVKHGEGPSRWIFPLLAVLCIEPGLPLPKIALSALEHISGLGLIAAVAWLAILLVSVTEDILSSRYRVDVADNLIARRIQTQFGMLHRIVVILVVVVTVSIMLMTFPAINHIGVSILASAGLASLVVGMAMKGTLANLIAGVQIAFAQPFRMGDAVVIQGEWGWIEEIGTMYVVVRIWDLRRLVIPLSYFLENSFENWTRTSADLLGYTYLYTDYTVPVDAVRAELKRICESTPLWNGKVCGVQVSDCDRYTMELRALMDARNSGDAWDLRCLVREKLLDFLQKNYPGSLPRYRGEFQTASTVRAIQGGPPRGRANSAPATAETAAAPAENNLRRSA